MEISISMEIKDDLVYFIYTDSGKGLYAEEKINNKGFRNDGSIYYGDQIIKLMKILKLNKFILQDKCFNSYYFKKKF